MDQDSHPPTTLKADGDLHDPSSSKRKESLATILRDEKWGGCVNKDDEPLIKAIVALGEATANIARHLSNYVEHNFAGTRNASGDDQLELDIQCDRAVFDAVRDSGVYHTVASEETPQETKVCGDDHEEAVFSLGCDPLDGSSIIDANFAVGSIYGIWPGTKLVGRTGREQVASAIAVYGPRTVLCVALAGRGGAGAGGTTPTAAPATTTDTSSSHPFSPRVFEVTLIGEDRSRWDVGGRRDRIVIEPSGKIFAPGNLRAANDHENYARLIQYWMAHRYQLRYSGGMVPDVYHILAKGKGIFANASSPKAKAKLRLLYEVAPIGLLVECAGGSAIHEGRDVSVLDVVIEHTDQRLGVCLGSRDEVNKYRDIMFSAANADADANMTTTTAAATTTGPS